MVSRAMRAVAAAMRPLREMHASGRDDVAEVGPDQSVQLRCRRDPRAFLQPWLARIAAAEKRKWCHSHREPLPSLRYPPALAAPPPSALWERSPALRPAFRVLPAFGSAPRVIELPLGERPLPFPLARCLALWPRRSHCVCCAWRVSGRASGASARRRER